MTHQELIEKSELAVGVIFEMGESSFLVENWHQQWSNLKMGNGDGRDEGIVRLNLSVYDKGTIAPRRDPRFASEFEQVTPNREKSKGSVFMNADEFFAKAKPVQPLPLFA